ncbi:hypothetical protein B0H10DRAFT_643714 [Mycena sp. CBHHK59/15]|nr:hypothetical protein B0H10DRAFT_643714 [Mycena sp. CBHHK59/15]
MPSSWVPQATSKSSRGLRTRPPPPPTRWARVRAARRSLNGRRLDMPRLRLPPPTKPTRTTSALGLSHEGSREPSSDVRLGRTESGPESHAAPSPCAPSGSPATASAPRPALVRTAPPKRPRVPAARARRSCSRVRFALRARALRLDAALTGLAMLLNALGRRCLARCRALPRAPPTFVPSRPCARPAFGRAALSKRPPLGVVWRAVECASSCALRLDPCRAGVSRPAASRAQSTRLAACLRRRQHHTHRAARTQLTYKHMTPPPTRCARFRAIGLSHARCRSHLRLRWTR